MNAVATVTPRSVLVAALAAWGVLLLLPVGRLSELPLLVLLVLGLVALARGGWRDPRLRLALALFACWWLPVLASLADAHEIERSLRTALAELRFLPFVAAVVLLLAPRADLVNRLMLWSGIVVALWVLDALAQAAFGISVGGLAGSDRLSGVFGDDNLKLGPVLAVLSPFVLAVAHARYGIAGFAVAALAVAAAVALAGSRAAWIVLAVVYAAWAWRLTRSAWRFAAVAAAGVVVLAVVGALFYQADARFAARVDRTAAGLTLDRAALDHALAGRVPIYETAARMIVAHPVNGVGVRGFRHAYPEYAAPDDRWVRPETGTGAMHPHQLVLEVLAETGLIGLAGWLTGLVLAVLAWRRASATQRARAAPAGLALVAMCFPLNTHYAFHSSFWALLFWWLLALWLAALASNGGARAAEDAR
jgi:O-antigen ligase